MSDKVWLVWADSGEAFAHEWDVIGIFSTRESAEAEARRCEEDVSVEEWTVEDNRG